MLHCHGCVHFCFSLFRFFLFICVNRAPLSFIPQIQENTCAHTFICAVYVVYMLCRSFSRSMYSCGCLCSSLVTSCLFSFFFVSPLSSLLSFSLCLFYCFRLPPLFRTETEKASSFVLILDFLFGPSPLFCFSASLSYTSCVG